MRKSNKFLFLVSALGVVFWALADNCWALTVSPPVIELNADPGQVLNFEIKIHNDDLQKREEFITSVLNFDAKKNENGEPQFFSKEDFPEQDLASEWFQLEKGPLGVEPATWRVIPVTVKVPEKAEPGGHYVSVFFGPKENEQKSKDEVVSISYYAGALVLLSVSGDVRQGGAVKEFSTENGQKFFRNLPVGFFARIENYGNLHFRPTGNVEIKNFWNKKVGEIPVIKSPTGGNILPESIRRYNLSWDSAYGEKIEKDFFRGFFERANRQRKEFHLGRYTAILTVALPRGETGTASVLFWLIPIELLIIILFLLLLLWAIINRYNRWIINRSANRTAKEPHDALVRKEATEEVNRVNRRV